MALPEPYQTFPKSIACANSCGKRPLYNASDFANPIWRALDLCWPIRGACLKLHGVRVNRIQTVSPVVDSDDTIDTIEYAWTPENLQDTYIPTNELVEHAYPRMLVADICVHREEVVSRGGSMWKIRGPSGNVPRYHANSPECCHCPQVRYHRPTWVHVSCSVLGQIRRCRSHVYEWRIPLPTPLGIKWVVLIRWRGICARDWEGQEEVELPRVFCLFDKDWEGPKEAELPHDFYLDKVGNRKENSEQE